MLLRLDAMTAQREENMNHLWQTLQTILRDYSARTEEKYGEYVELRERDNADTKNIRQNYMEIARITGEIGQLKATLEAGNLEHRIHVDQLRDYKKLLQAKQTALKRNMDAGQKIDKERMLKLVMCGTQANAVISISTFLAFTYSIQASSEARQTGGKRQDHSAAIGDLRQIGNGTRESVAIHPARASPGQTHSDRHRFQAGKIRCLRPCIRPQRFFCHRHPCR